MSKKDTTPLSNSRTLPSIKGRPTQDDSPQPVHQSMSNTKEKLNSQEAEENFNSSVTATGIPSPEELKRENTQLRIKLHEMQALVLESSLKNKGTEKPQSTKGIEATLVRANSKLFKLEELIKQKDEKIQQSGYEKRMLENIKREQAKIIENLNGEKSYYIKAVQDLQAEILALKKNTLGGMAEENKALKDQIVGFEKKLKSNKDLIHKQLQTIKLLDEKNTELAKAKSLTLNPLYDSNKRGDLYRQKLLSDFNAKSDLDTIRTLNLAFSSDEILDKLLEEQEKEIEEEEEEKRNKPKGEQAEVPEQEKKIVNWEQEYKKLRGVYIETRFDFERIDTKLKEEIHNLSKRLNEVEVQLREKTKEIEMLHQVLTSKRGANGEKSPLRESTENPLGGMNKSLKKTTNKVDKLGDMSNVGHEIDNQSSFQDDVKEILKMGPHKSDQIDENEEYQQKTNRDKALPESVEAVVKLGQFNPDSTFDDTEQIEKANVKRISSIAIWADNKSILGIRVNYETKDGKVFAGPQHLGEVSKEKYSKEPWSIGQGDALSRVRGAVAMTHGIIWIEFYTRKGVMVKFGSSEVGKESFDHQFGEDEIPILVKGSFSMRERGEKPSKQNISGLGFKTLKIENTEKADKGNKNDKADKVEKAEKAAKGEETKKDQTNGNKGEKEEKKGEKAGEENQKNKKQAAESKDKDKGKEEKKVEETGKEKQQEANSKESKKNEKKGEETDKNAVKKEEASTKPAGTKEGQPSTEDVNTKKGSLTTKNETKKLEAQKTGNKDDGNKQAEKPAGSKDKAKGTKVSEK